MRNNDRDEPSIAWFISFVVSFITGVITAIYYRKEIMDFVISALSAI